MYVQYVHFWGVIGLSSFLLVHGGIMCCCSFSCCNIFPGMMKRIYMHWAAPTAVWEDRYACSSSLNSLNSLNSKLIPVTMLHEAGIEFPGTYNQNPKFLVVVLQLAFRIDAILCS